MKTRKKKYIFFIFVLFLSWANSSHAQDLDKKISIKAKNKPLSELINTISQLGQINFSYSSQEIPVDKIINYSAKKATIRSILDELFKKNGIEYLVVENQLVLKVSKIKPDLLIEKKIRLQYLNILSAVT